MRNPDFKQYINLYNILTQKGQRTFIMYLMMTHPWEFDGTTERAEEVFKKIKIPFYTGSGPTRTPTNFTGSVRSTISRTSKRRRSCFSPDQPISSGPSISTTTRSSAGMTIG